MKGSTLIGAKLGYERLRSGSALFVLALSSLGVLAAALLEKRSHAESATEDVLSGVVFGSALPLLAYLISERACAGGRLERSVDSVARYGANRRHAVLGLLLTSGVVTALAGALFALLGVLGSHSDSAASLLFDIRSSVGIALVSGFAYALFFGAAALLGKQGGGRKWALFADFVFGSGASGFAAIYPRGHLRNLLGGTPVLGLSQPAAWLALLAIALTALAISFARSSE